MTANELLLKIHRNVVSRLTTGDITVTINGKNVDIKDVVLEGENGDYTCNIIYEEVKKVNKRDIDKLMKT